MAATLAAAMALLGVAAPASASVVRSQTLDITAVEPLTYTIDTHGQLTAGLVHLRFVNRGTAAHQAQLLRLNDGVTFAKWQADLRGPDPNVAVFGDATTAGGATPVLPGGREDVWDVLRAGTYVVACFVPGPNGVQHIFLGMYKPFDVRGATPRDPVARERHAGWPWFGTIRAHDLTYTMPRYLVDGSVIRFEDTDASDIHEVNLGKLAPGKTVADAKAWFVAASANPPRDPGPAPFTFAGGHGAEPPGHGGWFQVEADPGRYIAFCLVPDDKTGLPHAAMGMVVGVTVLPG